jgi:hypothetical protein
MRPQASRWLGVLAVALLAVVAPPTLSQAADPDADKPLLRRAFPGLDASLNDAPAFFRDTRLLLQIRTYYRNNEASPGV